jgi:serine/threonine-protein kinase
VEPDRTAREVLAPSPRRRAGRYELLFEIARGGMGAVYAGRLLGAHGVRRLVAIKRLTVPEDGTDATKRFLAEAWLTAKILHPNVVHTLDLFEDDGAPHIVMDLVQGVSLHQLLRQLHGRGERLEPAVAAWIAAQAAAGLHAAHELVGDDGEKLGIVHRDVSPQNVLLSFDGRVYVADFGIAKLRKPDITTESGVVRGKFAYMSPEQARAQAVDRTTDVFALGIVLHEMLNCERLFARETPAATVLAILEDKAPAPAVAPELAAIALRCLEKSPAARFASCGDLADALRAYLRASGAHADESDVTKLLDATFPGKKDDLAERLRAAEAAPAVVSAEGETGMTASLAPTRAERSSRRAWLALGGVVLVAGFALGARAALRSTKPSSAAPTAAPSSAPPFAAPSSAPLVANGAPAPEPAPPTVPAPAAPAHPGRAGPLPRPRVRPAPQPAPAASPAPAPSSLKGVPFQNL